jgi:hypothetical protein
MTAQRLWAGRDVHILREDAEGVEIEGAARLRPGQRIEIVTPGPLSADVAIRQAVVWSWTLMRTGSRGHMFRGFCRWT